MRRRLQGSEVHPYVVRKAKSPHIIQRNPVAVSGGEEGVPVVRGDGENGIVSPSPRTTDRKSTRLNSSHDQISYAVFCLKKTTFKPRRAHRRSLGHPLSRPRSPPPSPDRCLFPSRRRRTRTCGRFSRCVCTRSW